jgi:hypothetical protein
LEKQSLVSIISDDDDDFLSFRPIVIDFEIGRLCALNRKITFCFNSNLVRDVMNASSAALMSSTCRSVKTTLRGSKSERSLLGATARAALGVCLSAPFKYTPSSSDWHNTASAAAAAAVGGGGENAPPTNRFMNETCLWMNEYFHF